MSDPNFSQMFEKLMDLGAQLVQTGTRNATRIEANAAEILRTRERSHEIGAVLSRLEERQIAMGESLGARIDQLSQDVQELTRHVVNGG